jgi:hypothetical protein
MSSALAHRSPEADDGDTVDDILKRLGNAEADVSKLKIDVGVIAANYATKSDIAEVKTSIAELRTELKVEIAEVRVEIAGVRTELRSGIAGVRTAIAEVRTELKDEIGRVRTAIESMDAKIIRWVVATGIATAGLAFSAAKFIH